VGALEINGTSPVLVVFGGLPAVGKTALARALATRLRAAYVRVDTIEQALLATGLTMEEIWAGGYFVAYEMAAENLRLGVSVIAEAVNALEAVRENWVTVAEKFSAAIFQVEVLCSDPVEHRARLEARPREFDNIKPRWEDVRTRRYERWESWHIRLETAGRTLQQSIDELFTELGLEPG
jgi:predicted kinase